MEVQELSQNLRIAGLARLTQELQHSQTADQTLRALQRGLGELDGFVGLMLLSTRGLTAGQYRVVRTQLTEDPQTDVLQSARWQGGPVQSGGILAEIIGQLEPRLIHDVNWSDDPYFYESLDGYASIIALPLGGNHLPMNWAILLKKSPQRFSMTELEEAVERAALVSPLLENQIRVGELVRADRQAEREARQVGELQRALLPTAAPRCSGLEIAASYEPCDHAGGDLYDIFPLDEQFGDTRGAIFGPSRWCIFMGDIAGHGLAAAVVMAIVQAVLHARPNGITRAAMLLTHANQQLSSKGLGGFVTAFLGVYDPASRRLTYANAGHPPPLLRHSSNGSISCLDEAANYPLGIDDAETFDEATVQLERGDTVLLYTDGITEARGTDNDLFESDRLVCALRDGGDRPAELIEYLRAAVRAHEQGEAARDDQTMVAAQIL
jgi:sigma-B regulation protein RsbU (phosphoserine phosphatase)